MSEIEKIWTKINALEQAKIMMENEKSFLDDKIQFTENQLTGLRLRVKEIQESKEENGDLMF